MCTNHTPSHNPLKKAGFLHRSPPHKKGKAVFVSPSLQQQNIKKRVYKLRFATPFFLTVFHTLVVPPRVFSPLFCGFQSFRSSCAATLYCLQLFPYVTAAANKTPLEFRVPALSLRAAAFVTVFPSSSRSSPPPHPKTCAKGFA